MINGLSKYPSKLNYQCCKKLYAILGHKIRVQIRELVYLLLIRLPMTLIGHLKGNLLYVHWGRIGKNFGDCLSPIILKHYGFTPVFCTSNDKSDIVVAGTLLQWLTRDYQGYIAGAGGDNHVYDFKNAHILAVRGKLTLNNFTSINNNTVLGDPGLLMPLIYNGSKEKEWQLGIVPHFVDYEHPFIEKIMNRCKGRCKIINVRRDPKDVINEITACNYIVSSSLHGLIIADAYGIPNIRIVIKETMPSEFYDYKFDDYYSIFNYRHVPIEITDSTDPSVLISKCARKNA